MEQDYKALTEENMVKDFKICLLYLIVFNTVSGIFSLANESWTDLCYSGGSLVALVVLVFLQKPLRKYIQTVTLVIILSYNISRLFQVHSFFNTSSKARLFLAGYGVASMQNVLFMRINKASQKAFGIIVILILRFLMLSLYIDPGSFVVGTFIRHSMIDFYLIYTYYIQEVNFRKIYMNFVQKKEELLKFKELLADSLPQGLVVITQATNHLLFFNKAFQNTFYNDDTTDSSSSALTDSSLKQTLENLLVEQSTIRDSKEGGTTLDALNNINYPKSFEDILEKLGSNKCFDYKTVSLAASLSQKDNRRLFEVTITKINWDSLDAIAVLFNDITYQENLIALKLANVNKDKVIATVSHELRTPLNGIIGILDIVETKVGNSEVAEYLSLCKDNAQLLLSLVNSILDLQQISAGKLKLNPINIDLRKVAKSICQLFYFQCQQKNISLECEVHDDVPKRIFNDENRLRQVLINLVGNAIKFTSKGGVKIEVILNPNKSGNLQISVIDTGIGIKQEDQRHLFKMYGKIADGESVNKNGVGLGLTISNALVTLLNGDPDSQGISVESESGVGTKFYFEIPQHLQEKKPVQITDDRLSDEILTVAHKSDTEDIKIALAQKSNSHEGLKVNDEFSDSNLEKDYDELAGAHDIQLKMTGYDFIKRLKTDPGKNHNQEEQCFIKIMQENKEQKSNQSSLKLCARETAVDSDESAHYIDILIVDDNPFNLLVAKSLVQELKCNVKTALSGQEALDIVKTTFSQGIIFKAIFMDCQMPIMDGFETTGALKAMMQNKEIPEVPIYGWTANNSEEDVKRCYEAGMIGYLPKPASRSDISKVISKL